MPGLVVQQLVHGWRTGSSRCRSTPCWCGRVAELLCPPDIHWSIFSTVRVSGAVQMGPLPGGHAADRSVGPIGRRRGRIGSSPQGAETVRGIDPRAPFPQLRGPPNVHRRACRISRGRHGYLREVPPRPYCLRFQATDLHLPPVQQGRPTARIRRARTYSNCTLLHHRTVHGGHDHFLY